MELDLKDLDFIHTQMSGVAMGSSKIYNKKKRIFQFLVKVLHKD